MPLARRILLGTMDSVGVDAQVSQDLCVALSEACANAVEHAGHGAPDEYRVTVTIDGERCGVEVVDFGPGFGPDPHPVDGQDLAADEEQDQEWFLSDAAALFCSDYADYPDYDAFDEAFGQYSEPLAVLPADPTAECGRGLFLISSLMDHVRFTNHPCRGAVVTFDKALRWRPGTGAATRALLRAS
ncbi:ATP-binding protein [Mangrovactinospora gilvigrisea]|uniref:ATP-binding protein n=1 Tax=Mangrovactinospora gilvigrisea TaxID=1428644 RepID=UPI003AF34B82